MPEQIGLDMKLYRNSGTYASPTWVLVDNVADLKGPDSMGEAVIGIRGKAYEQYEPGLRKVSFDWDMIKDETDTNFSALRTAYGAKTLTEFAFANGAIATTGTKYFRIECKLFEFSRDESLEGANKYHVVAKPCWSANVPSYVTV